MKLADWSLQFYRLPYRREVVWSNAVEKEGLYALLKLVADDGSTGVAEGTIKPTWSGVSQRSVRAGFEDVVLPKFEKIDLSKPEEVSKSLQSIPENRLIKGMVETALWTLRACAAKQPLWQLWGGNRSVELSYTVTRQAPAAMAAESAEVCKRYGFRTLKVKGGQGVDTDLQALKEIRAAVGGKVELFVDANAAYRRDEAADYVQKLAAAGVTIAEDPCPLIPDAEFEKLQRDAPIPVLVDNAASLARDAALFLERGAKAVSIKPGRVGLAETRATQALAGEKARLTVGIYAESALGTIIALQQAAALPKGKSLPAEQSFFLEHKAQVTFHAPEIKDGKIELPGQPDLSKLVDWDAVKRYAL